MADVYPLCPCVLLLFHSHVSLFISGYHITCLQKEQIRVPCCDWRIVTRGNVQSVEARQLELEHSVDNIELTRVTEVKRNIYSYRQAAGGDLVSLVQREWVVYLHAGPRGWQRRMGSSHVSRGNMPSFITGICRALIFESSEL